jgi:HTH-type transcriptional regulator / antitoxin HigA
MKIQIIKTETDYDIALDRVDELLDLKVDKNTELGDELELLLLVIRSYEDLHHAVAMPDPIEAIKQKMAEHGLKNADLQNIIGKKSYVSQVLNKKKPLTAAMMRDFHHKMGIPARILLA